MQQYDNRFKDAPWYEKCKEEQILVIGLGGIGSSTMYCLAKTIPAEYIILDGDTVEEYNIGCQFFEKNDVGYLKVESIHDMLVKHTSTTVSTIGSMWKEGDIVAPITITALDNMKTRKEVFEQWKTMEDREILIDGRLRATMYEVYVVTPGREAEYEATLFEDSEVPDDVCTFKQTAYFAMMIGAKITQILTNYLSNKYTNSNTCVVPFKVSEVGELFWFDLKN